MEKFKELYRQRSLQTVIDTKTYQDTEQLLKLYRQVLFRANQEINRVEAETRLTDRHKLSDYIGTMIEFDARQHRHRIYEKVLSVGTSLSLLEVMEEALVSLREYPRQGELYSRMLRYAYFDTNQSTNDEIMELFNLSRSTYFRKRKEAIKSYAVMLWGFVIPGLQDSTTCTEQTETETGLCWD